MYIIACNITEVMERAAKINKTFTYIHTYIPFSQKYVRFIFSLSVRVIKNRAPRKKVLYLHRIPLHIEIFLLDIERRFKKQTTVKLRTVIRHSS